MNKAQIQYIEQLEAANMALAKKIQTLQQTMSVTAANTDQLVKHLTEVETERDRLQDVVSAARHVLMLGRQ